MGKLRLPVLLILLVPLAFADPVTLTGLMTGKDGKQAALLFFPNSNYGLRIPEGQERLGIKLMSIDTTHGSVVIRRGDNDETLRLGGDNNNSTGNGSQPAGLVAGTPRAKLNRPQTAAEQAAATRRVRESVSGLGNPGANDPKQAAEFRARLLEQAQAEAQAAGSAPSKPVFAPSDQ